ncbi:DoxX family protein [Flagellimonas aquimarina]|jgi:putative oxidoreductase|uniref:DoxX family protein n=1 Tax=Flagellimonas aquimarina TaxID=2201895 RepID=A0A316KY27_9FLAO|nr:DoxX family membrane protein [Allomuricauda koreensis]PWL37988.1 DoxX family protein [Allomuricauda koreensis]
MNSKVFLVARILLGLFVLVFGLNKFFGFIPFGEMPEAAMNYFGALSSTHTLKIVGVIEILAGLAFILNKYGALMALILMSVSVNAVLFHATLAPADIGGALALIILNIVVLLGYKDRYKDILRA